MPARQAPPRPAPVRGSPSVFILGAGKVGSSLSRALRERHVPVSLRSARSGLPRRTITEDLLVLAVRDGELPRLAAELARSGLVSPRTSVVHCAGALGPEVLAPLQGSCAGVAQMHPMISFAKLRAPPTLSRGQVHLEGDLPAVRRGRQVARLLGMTARTIPGLDKIAYHAAAGLVANGAAALAAGGVRLLGSAGVPADVASAMLGPLLRSVADNVERLGLPDALTGPVRRGDAKGVARHLETIRARCPELVPLYVAMAAAQLPMAQALAEAPAATWDEIERLLGEQSAPTVAGRAKAR